MSAFNTTETTEPTEAGVVAKLSTLDRFLPVWILAAMAVGLLAGRLIPGLGEALGAVAIDGVSLPIALGLLVMMYPVLAKVRYDRLDTVTGDRRLLVSSLILNWLIGPALMTGLAWATLPDLEGYRNGVILVPPQPLPASTAQSVFLNGNMLAAGCCRRGHAFTDSEILQP